MDSEDTKNVKNGSHNQQNEGIALENNGYVNEEVNFVKNGSNIQQDEGDALGNNSYPIQQIVAKMPTERYSQYYNMNHKNRGIALIFNHEHFNFQGLKSRSGTKVDCESFMKTLTTLGFDVYEHNDLNHKDVFRTIQEGVSIAVLDIHAVKLDFMENNINFFIFNVNAFLFLKDASNLNIWRTPVYQHPRVAAMDHSDYDCLVITVLSHGEMGTLYASDMPYRSDNLWAHFTADKCPTLAGKPKLFFIQACQGDRLDPGIKLSSRTETDGHEVQSYTIPTHADFLIAYSTVPGYYAWRNTTRGSWFMQALCAELAENGFNRDILTLLTFVCQRVAFDFESDVRDNRIMDRQKQIPCITSMLTRLLKFTKTSGFENKEISKKDTENVFNRFFRKSKS